MKIFKGFFLLISFFVVILITESCFFRCDKVYSFEYSFSSFVIHPMYNEEIMLLMGSDIGGADENPLEFRKDFGFHIEFIADITKVAKNKQTNNSLIQSAYAWSCEDDTYYPKNYIVSIQVFSDKDFDETHPVGSDISKYFKIREWFGPGDGFNLFPWLTSFDDYFGIGGYESKGGFNNKITCLITATTIETGDYNFNIVVRLSDDTFLEQSVQAILE